MEFRASGLLGELLRVWETHQRRGHQSCVMYAVSRGVTRAMYHWPPAPMTNCSCHVWKLEWTHCALEVIGNVTLISHTYLPPRCRSVTQCTPRFLDSFGIWHVSKTLSTVLAVNWVLKPACKNHWLAYEHTHFILINKVTVYRQSIFSSLKQ